MNTTHLEKAQKAWGWSMTIKLENGRLYVANDGFITDNLEDITAKKRFGEFRGFYYQYKSKRNTMDIIRVIKSLSNSDFCERVVIA